jgi:hypothetical protein
VNFFQRHSSKPADEIEPPVEPPVLARENEPKATNTIEPIHVSNAQYDLLTRALHPEVTSVLHDLKIDPPEPNVPAVMDGAVQLPLAVSPDRPGTPIV